jgi:hypothetical protein
VFRKLQPNILMSERSCRYLYNYPYVQEKHDTKHTRYAR